MSRKTKGTIFFSGLFILIATVGSGVWVWQERPFAAVWLIAKLGQTEQKLWAGRLHLRVGEQMPSASEQAQDHMLQGASYLNRAVKAGSLDAARELADLWLRSDELRDKEIVDLAAVERVLAGHLASGDSNTVVTLAQVWLAQGRAAKAAGLLENASEKGNALASFFYGELLSEDRGVPLDYEGAILQYSRAALGGVELAIERLVPTLVLCGDFSRAQLLAACAADAGYPQAFYTLALFFMGDSVVSYPEEPLAYALIEQALGLQEEWESESLLEEAKSDLAWLRPRVDMQEADTYARTLDVKGAKHLLEAQIGYTYDCKELLSEILLESEEEIQRARR